MANIYGVQTNVEAPDRITIHLVRKDYLDTSNVFRIVFEFFLTLLGAFIGYLISLKPEDKITPFHWLVFAVVLCSCIAFLTLSVINYNLATKSTSAKQPE